MEAFFLDGISEEVRVLHFHLDCSDWVPLWPPSGVAMQVSELFSLICQSVAKYLGCWRCLSPVKFGRTCHCFQLVGVSKFFMQSHHPAFSPTWVEYGVAVICINCNSDNRTDQPGHSQIHSGGRK